MATQMSLAEACQGDIYSFVVGTERQEYKAHAAIFTRLSEPFMAMFSLQMRESLEKRVVVEDVEPVIFNSVLEFAYSQMYQSRPLPKDVQHNSSRTLTQAIDDYTVLSPPQARYCARCANKLGANHTSCTALACFHGTFVVQYCLLCGGYHNVLNSNGHCAECEYDYYKFVTPFKERKYPIKFQGSPGHPSNNPLHHAKLYTFAKKWMMPELQALCLCKLHRDLCKIRLNEAVAKNICDTIREIYDNTWDGNGSDQELVGADARELVLDFAVTCAPKLVKFDAFTNLLVEGDEFVVNWGKKVAERVGEMIK